jgi:YidC/Oxa1 family membrane protein insertase
MGAWDAIVHFIVWVIQWFDSWCADWGLAIILITLVFRLLIYPITRKQFKASYKMQKMKPQMDAIKAKYPDDPQRQQQETMRLYREAKFNPLSGCLPALLQMPIFLALYQALMNIQNYADPVPDPFSLYGIIPDLSLSPSTVFGNGDFIGLIPYIILMLLFGVSLVLPMLINKQTDKQSMIMMIVMGVVMLWFSWGAPAGVLLYWDASALMGVAQQFGSRWILEREDKRAQDAVIDVTPVNVEVDRKERKARPRKKAK